MKSKDTMKLKLAVGVTGLLLTGSTLSFGAAAQSLTPAPDSTFTQRRPAFTWTAATGATWHWLWIQKDFNYYHDEWVNGTSWTPAWDLPPGYYQWWVGSWVGSSYGPWSSGATCIRTEPAIVSTINSITNDGGNIQIVAGAGITVNSDAGNHKVTIAAAGTATNGDVTIQSGNLKLGSLYAAAAQEKVQIVRGTVSGANVTNSGVGWSSTRTATGCYTLTFSPSFSALPTIVASSCSVLPSVWAIVCVS